MLLCAISMIEMASLRIIPINIDGFVQNFHAHVAAKPWALPHEVPSHLWNNYGDGDYELHVARRFLADYTKYRQIDPPVSMVPSMATRFFCRVLAGCPWSLEKDPSCFSPWCGRIAWYNDEVYHGSVRIPKVPKGSLYIEGARDADWGQICSMYQCLNVTIAAMSGFLRSAPPDLAIFLGLPRAAHSWNNSKSEWRQRPHFCSFLYMHLRPDRTRFRDVLEQRSRISIPLLNGSGRNSVRIFDEAVEIQEPYRFSIAFESSTSHVHYVTEKIVNAFAAGTIPIYFGSPEISKYFNPRAFINVDTFKSFEAAADHVIAVERNETLAQEYLREPPCTPQNIRNLFWWRY